MAFSHPSFADQVLFRDFKPGSPEEAAAIQKNLGSAVMGERREVMQRGGWIYRFTAPPGVRCRCEFRSDQKPAVDALSFESKPIPSRREVGSAVQTVICTTPVNQTVGGSVRFFFHSAAPFSVSDVRFSIDLADANGDGVPDAITRIMGLSPQERAIASPRPPRPHTSFQTGGPYRPDIAVPTDAVLAYTDNPDDIKSWSASGLRVQTMGGFREGKAYAQAHPEEVQRDVNGGEIEIGGSSYYLAQTQTRIEAAKEYYRKALASGSSAVCPEEPEYWARAGYEDAFKHEWQARYATPWQIPHSGIDARYKSEQLKQFLTTRLISDTLSDARRVNPGATRMAAVHSPVTYYQWGITCPDWSLFRIPDLQEMIGQVWTGTARTPVRSAGVRSERTFELGFLEYSSLFNMARGTGKRMWFLMDPVEDNPSLPMTDYHKNYELMLLASLMFPDIDCYEVMPWPGRIYGRVPQSYATEINTVVGSLADMWQYGDGNLEAGSRGIGTFVSDTMGLQREHPSPSDYDGFYGLSLPLVLHGVPVDVLTLDRATEPRYLDREKVLLISYDFLKPADPAINRALAEWTKAGGSLIVVGGTDAYNSVTDSWWRKAGLSSPVADLFDQLGIQTRQVANGPDKSEVTQASLNDGSPKSPAFSVLVKSSGTAARRRGQYTLDLTPFVDASGSVDLRFEDETPQDGGGPALYSLELSIGGKLAASFRAGSELETRFLDEDGASQFNGEARFADRGSFWVYRFDNLPHGVPVSVTLDMGSGFVVKAAPIAAREPVMRTTEDSFEKTVRSLRLRPGYPVTLYQAPPGAKALYSVADGAPAVWEARVGQGNLTFIGIAPGYLTASAQTSRWMREVVKRAFNQAGGEYAESSSFIIRRGPYVGLRALGREAQLDGRYVNLLDPELSIVEDPTVSPRNVGLYFTVGRPPRSPRLLALSGRLRSKAEQRGVTAFTAQAPANTTGAARVWTGRRKLAGVKAFDLWGESVPVRVTPEEQSILVTYPNNPQGVIVRIGWK